MRLNRPTNRFSRRAAAAGARRPARRPEVSSLRGHLAGDPAGADDADRAVRVALLEPEDGAWPTPQTFTGIVPMRLAVGQVPSSRSGRRRSPAPGARARPGRERRRGSRPRRTVSGSSGPRRGRDDGRGGAASAPAPSRSTTTWRSWSPWRGSSRWSAAQSLILAAVEGRRSCRPAGARRRTPGRRGRSAVHVAVGWSASALGHGDHALGRRCRRSVVAVSPDAVAHEDARRRAGPRSRGSSWAPGAITMIFCHQGIL